MINFINGITRILTNSQDRVNTNFQDREGDEEE